MSDMVEQLTLRANFVSKKVDAYERPFDANLDREAAARITELEASLKPFARAADDLALHIPKVAGDDEIKITQPIDGNNEVIAWVAVDDFRRARAALAGQGDGG